MEFEFEGVFLAGSDLDLSFLDLHVLTGGVEMKDAVSLLSVVIGDFLVSGGVQVYCQVVMLGDLPFFQRVRDVV